MSIHLRSKRMKNTKVISWINNRIAVNSQVIEWTKQPRRLKQCINLTHRTLTYHITITKDWLREITSKLNSYPKWIISTWTSGGMIEVSLMITMMKMRMNDSLTSNRTSLHLLWLKRLMKIQWMVITLLQGFYPLLFQCNSRTHCVIWI